jgi:hypothetical protein
MEQNGILKVNSKNFPVSENPFFKIKENIKIIEIH